LVEIRMSLLISRYFNAIGGDQDVLAANLNENGDSGVEVFLEV
jgi:hypothetical protein